MAANYISNPTAVQSPATAPAVNNPPVLSLIQDADGNTAANLYQAWKVLADNEALILAILGGTRTAKSLHVDGTGGATTTTPDGTLQLSASGLQTSLPTPTPTLGAFYKDFALFAAVTFNGTGAGISISHAYNITSATRNSTGNYTFNYVTAAGSTPVAMIASSVAGFQTIAPGPSSMVVTTANTSNTATDYSSPVHVVLIGGF